MRQLGKWQLRIIKIDTNGSIHIYYKNKYILIVTHSHLQSGREQLRYYNYNIKVANNYLASFFSVGISDNLEFINLTMFAKYVTTTLSVQAK